jgi:hypothetical protein
MSWWSPTPCFIRLVGTRQNHVSSVSNFICRGSRVLVVCLLHVRERILRRLRIAQYNTFGAKKSYSGVLGEETDIDVSSRNIKSSPL